MDDSLQKDLFRIVSMAQPVLFFWKFCIQKCKGVYSNINLYPGYNYFAASNESSKMVNYRL